MFLTPIALVGSDPGAQPPANVGLADLERLIAGKTLAIANPDRDLDICHGSRGLLHQRDASAAGLSRKDVQGKPSAFSLPLVLLPLR